MPDTSAKGSNDRNVDLAEASTPRDDFLDDLLRDGYAVVKGAIPVDRAAKYADEMMQWLEDFNLGFDRSDPTTIHERHLPIINERGMCLDYGVAHETFTWSVRSEPGVIDAFARKYETDDLIVSFDGVNIGFANRTDLPQNTPWPHKDQDPANPGFQCLQGLVNLLPSGEHDGGLIVMPGGHLTSDEFHQAFRDEPNPIPRWTKEWYGFTREGVKWLEDRGLKWKKVCMGPGDLVVWDSRTPHYNLASTSNQHRLAIYTCYQPVAEVSQESLIRKRKAFEEWRCTSHWPDARQVGRAKRPIRDGQADPYNYELPRSGRPQLSERAFRLTGIPYIKVASSS